MNYKQALFTVNEFRNPYKGKLVKNNVRLYKDDWHGNNTDTELIFLQLHQTDIITWWPCGKIVLNSNGWQTATTKSRMNEFLPSNIRVFQKDHVWYVTIGNTTLEYFDGMELKTELDTILAS